MKYLVNDYCYYDYSVLNADSDSYFTNWQPINTNTSTIFVSNVNDSFLYTKSSSIKSYSYEAIMNTFMGGGYVFKMQGNLANLQNQLNLLKHLNWIDKQTSALFVEFTLFNPNVNLFEYCSILFEILPSGNFVNSIQVYPIDVLSMDNQGLFKILIYLFYMGFIVLFMIVEVRHFIKIKFQYFTKFNNYLDLFLIGFSWAAFAIFLLKLESANQINNVLRQENVKIEEKLINLQLISYFDILQSYFLGFCAYLASLRFLKLLRFNKRIFVFITSFKNCLKELTSFGLVFFVAWFAFVQLFYFLYNYKLPNFATLSNSMETCIRMILGKESILFVDKYGNYDIKGICLFILFAICIVYVLMNIFLTIVYESFVMTCADKSLDREDPHLFDYLMSMFKPIMFCWKSKVKNKEMVYSESYDRILERFNDVIIQFERVIVLILNIFKYFFNFKFRKNIFRIMPN